jgi:hypothetical protein
MKKGGGPASGGSAHAPGASAVPEGFRRPRRNQHSHAPLENFNLKHSGTPDVPLRVTADVRARPSLESPRVFFNRQLAVDGRGGRVHPSGWYQTCRFAGAHYIIRAPRKLAASSEKLPQIL